MNKMVVAGVLLALVALAGAGAVLSGTVSSGATFGGGGLWYGADNAPVVGGESNFCSTGHPGCD